MDYVCEDFGGAWFHKNCVYYKKQNGIITGRITAKNIPDPFKIFEERMKFNKKHGMNMREQPTTAVYALWEHKNANINTKL